MPLIEAPPEGSAGAEGSLTTSLGDVASGGKGSGSGSSCSTSPGIVPLRAPAQPPPAGRLVPQPAAPSPSPGGGGIGSAPASSRAPLRCGSLSVLVAEDDKLSQIVMGGLLRARGAAVTMVGDGAQARCRTLLLHALPSSHRCRPRPSPPLPPRPRALSTRW